MLNLKPISIADLSQTPDDHARRYGEEAAGMARLASAAQFSEFEGPQGFIFPPRVEGDVNFTQFIHIYEYLRAIGPKDKLVWMHPSPLEMPFKTTPTHALSLNEEGYQINLLDRFSRMRDRIQNTNDCMGLAAISIGGLALTSDGSVALGEGVYHFVAQTQKTEDRSLMNIRFSHQLGGNAQHQIVVNNSTGDIVATNSNRKISGTGKNVSKLIQDLTRLHKKWGGAHIEGLISSQNNPPVVFRHIDLRMMSEQPNISGATRKSASRRLLGGIIETAKKFSPRKF